MGNRPRDREAHSHPEWGAGKPGASQWKDLTLTPGGLCGRYAEESAEGIVPTLTRWEGPNLSARVCPEMRKDIGRQKITALGQLDLFSTPWSPAGKPADGIGDGQPCRDELSSRLKEQHARTANITERIVDVANLNKAMLQVERNKGSGGGDRKSTRLNSSHT